METNKSHLISVVLPVHNAGKHLADCLESLLNQSYSNIEIIVVDDFSKDTSTQILNKYKRLAGRKLRVYRNVKRYGMGISLNRAMRKTRGKFITFMNSHDLCTRDRLKRQLNFLLHNPKTVAVGSQCAYIDEKQKKLGKSNFPLIHEEIARVLLTGNTMHFESALINAYLLPKDLLRFPPATKHFLYTNLFMKLLPYGNFANLNQCFYYQTKLHHSSLQILKKNFLSYAKLWAKARFIYDLRLPFGSLVEPLLR